MKKLRYFLALFLSMGLVLAPVSTAHAGLETGTYVSDLNTSNPVNGDPVSQGAAHLRLIKAVLQATFPNGDAPIYGLRSGTVQTLSGTTADITGIPSWAKRVTISVASLSLNGTATPVLRLGDAGGIENSGYAGSVVQVADSSNTAAVSISVGIPLGTSTAASIVYHGVITLTLLSASTNTWVFSGTLGRSDTTAVVTISGSKSLSEPLDRIRFLNSGSDSFDAGTVNILYE